MHLLTTLRIILNTGVLNERKHPGLGAIWEEITRREYSSQTGFPVIVVRKSTDINDLTP